MSKGWLIGGAVSLAALLIASIAVALTQREEPFTEGTPERAVQRFLGAIEAEDFALAHSLLSDDIQQECQVTDLASGSNSFDQNLKKSRVTLEKTSILDDTAVVVVRVTRFRAGGPFEASEYSYQHSFSLERASDGQWRIKESAWPFYGKCSRPVSKPPTPVLTPIPPIPAQGGAHITCTRA